MNVSVRYEQAVYGSFAFCSRGYGVLARSSGCRPEWLAALKTACQRYGEPPAGVGEATALFARRIERGPWMITGVFPQGCDDAGRPGALAFHSLFVDRWTYARAGADPFAFGGLTRGDWGAADLDTTLPPGRATIRRASFRRTVGPLASHEQEGDGEIESLEEVVEAIARGRRVAVESAGPIDRMAREVWRALPFRARLRASVATWAFDNANGFDLAALPRLGSGTREAADVILASRTGRI
ncbi:MAG: hypothetical protein ACYC61_23185 [Isosphaeraceae bacterium]